MVLRVSILEAMGFHCLLGLEEKLSRVLCGNDRAQRDEN